MQTQYGSNNLPQISLINELKIDPNSNDVMIKHCNTWTKINDYGIEDSNKQEIDFLHKQIDVLAVEIMRLSSMLNAQNEESKEFQEMRENYVDRVLQLSDENN